MSVRPLAPRAALVALVAVLAGIGSTPAQAAARTHAKAPRCADLRGDTEAQNARWRVFRVRDMGEGEPDEPLWACRRGLRGARTVVRVALAGTQCAVADCVTTRVLDLREDRLLVYEDGIAPDYAQQFRVIDLAARRSAKLGPTVRYQPADVLGSLVFHWAHLTGAGAVFLGQEALDARARGGFSVLDDRGDSHFNANVGDMEPSRGGRGAEPGVYLTGPTGVALRVAAHGAAPLRWSRARGLTLMRNHLPVRRSKRVKRRTLGTGGGAIDLVRRLRGTRRAWLEHSDVGARVRFADLARRAKEAKVVVANESGALVRARFADAPRTERVRLYNSTMLARPLVDLPPTAVPAEPGRVAVTFRNALAIADGDRLRVWDPTPRTIPAPGAHDLVAVGRNGVYYTDGAGRPHRISLRDAIGTDPPPIGLPFPRR